MRKATRKNKRNGKQILRKKQTFRKNRKISGGYKEEDRGTWIQVVFDEKDKQKIKEYFANKNDRWLETTEIRDELFPKISDKGKANAAYEIQLILKRGAAGG
jgi:N-acetylmuramoyl-L-alanine amidase CwlA